MSAPGGGAINLFLSPSVEACVWLRSLSRKRSSAEDVIRVVEVCVGDLPVMLNTHFPLCKDPVFIMQMAAFGIKRKLCTTTGLLAQTVHTEGL